MSIKCFLFLMLTLCLSACGTSTSQLRDDGRSASYIDGFHDGRHSGIAEAGNSFEHYIRDDQRYAEEPDYQEGWIAGEAEGKRLQNQSVAVGNFIGGAYTASQIAEEIEQDRDFEEVGNEAIENIDTSGLESLGN